MNVLATNNWDTGIFVSFFTPSRRCSASDLLANIPESCHSKYLLCEAFTLFWLTMA